MIGGSVDAGVAAALRAVEADRRRLEAREAELLAGSGLDPASLAAMLCIDVREARARLKRAELLAPRRTLTGQPLPPLLPLTARAVAAGRVSAAQVDVIGWCADKIPPAAPPTAVELVERVLLDAARVEAPRALRRTATALLTRLDPDGVEPVEKHAERKRSFTLLIRPDGTSVPRGLFTAETTALLTTVLNSLATPVAGDGEPDPRSAPQRRHDGLAEAMTRLIRSDTLPAAGGVPVTILASTTLAELTAAAENGARHGLAVLDTGATLSVPQLLRMATDAAVVPVVFDDLGGVLAYGRGRRLASRGQRLALAARDGGYAASPALTVVVACRSNLAYQRLSCLPAERPTISPSSAATTTGRSRPTGGNCA